MATNNPYSKSFKTKREEYEEKLKQRNENENWIFGNTFGRPGGGAPLRDKNGNVVSNLKSVANQNIYKYEAKDFSKGDNNISVVNHKIYERNNGEIANVISDPYTPFRSYINQFESNNNANINSNNFNGIPNINNINHNKSPILISPDQINNLNYPNIQLDNEEQKKELYLNQFRQNPYLIQTPYGIITQYPMTHPFLSLNTNPNQIQNQNIIQNNNNNLPMNINYNNQNEYQRPYSSINQNINNNINYSNNDNNNNKNISNIDNYNNISNNFITTDITGGGRRKLIRKLPESTLFTDIDQEKIKLDKEKKMDEWKKELLVQINEKKRREAEEKRRMKEREKKEELNNEKYKKLKKKQKEEQQKIFQKKINQQLQNEIDGSGGSMGNLLDISNDIEQVNKSMHSQNNLALKDMQNNDFSQNNIQVQENLNNNFENNNYYSNNINQLYQNQEEQNFKSYIDRQYHLLNDALNHDINNEMKRISEEVENNYSPFTKQFLLMNTQSKTTAELTIENEKKFKKIQDLIEERKLVDYILGQRERPPTPQKENEKEESDKIDLPVPSYFGINRDTAENKYLGLHSKSSFIGKNENLANFIASGRNQNVDNNIPIIGNDLKENQEINNKYNQIMNDELDINSNYNQKVDTRKATFGTNIYNDEALGGSINYAKNLDNISTFIPLNKNRENINFTNEQKIKYIPGLNNDFNKYKDKDMEDLFKDLDKIYELTNKIDVTSKARNIADRFEKDLNRKINLNQEPIDNISINDSKYNENNNLQLNQDKISEEKSNTSNNKNITNSNLSENNTNGKNKTNSNLGDNYTSGKNKTNSNLSENKSKDKISQNSNNIIDNENIINNENDSNKEINSNKEKSSSQNEKVENELNNSQNSKEHQNKEENIEDNKNQENINNIEKVDNEPQNDENNNINENPNQNEDDEEYEYDEVEEEVEQ